MVEYQQAGFIGQPTMAAVNTKHLLINRAILDQLKKLNDRVTSLASNAELASMDGCGCSHHEDGDVVQGAREALSGMTHSK